MDDEEKFKTFITDPNVELFVGKNFETYCRKWNNMFTKAQSIDKMASRRSWNWAAFFLFNSWLFYRKTYGD